MRVILEASFRDLFPEAMVGLVVASGVDNRRNADLAAAELAAANVTAALALRESKFGNHPAVAPWREAYQRFGMKPSRYRSSIESLLRAARKDGVREINPLVDLYNAVSLRHLLPCGGEDLDAIAGDLRLTLAQGGESFLPLGALEDQPPAPGEVVYADDAGIVCRAWNWREAERTKLTPATTRAILVIEALPPRTVDEVREACEELADLVSLHLGAECGIALLGAGEPYAVAIDA